jgi:phospholipase/carboxylesterase
LDIESREDREGLEKTHGEISKLIQQEIQSGILPEHIFLGGFSQGGAQAIYIGLRAAQKLAGIIVFSGYLPFYKNLAQEIPSSFPNYSAPIFWAQGTQDTIVPPLFGEVSVKALKNIGVSVDFHSYPMGHSVCEEEIKDLAGWIVQKSTKKLLS